MKKDGDNYVDNNVVYLGRDYTEAEPQLEFEPIDPRVKEDILNILEGGNGTIPRKIHREVWNPFKIIQQWNNQRMLEHARERILFSGNVRLLHPEDVQVKHLDSTLTNDTNSYVWNVAEGYVAAFGFDHLRLTSFAKELLHPKELERYQYNIEDHEFQGGDILSRFQWGIALVVNRRWMPRENIERYKRARMLYFKDLEQVVFQHQRDYLAYLEENIHGNPLYNYITELYGEKS